jgi:hypothetical protein
MRDEGSERKSMKQMTEIEEKAEIALTYLTVRKEHLMCMKCYEIEPIHPGDGTPAISFITALELAAIRHADCALALQRSK